MMLFLIGFMAGCLAGLVIVSLCVAAREKGGISYPKIVHLPGEILEKAAS